MTGRAFGRAARNEDPALLTGRATFVDDVPLPGCLHVAFFRSPVAHARVRGLEVSDALRLSDVVAAFTADDLGGCSKPPPLVFPTPGIPGLTVHLRTQPPLAREKVRYVGEPLVAVVAGSRYAAEDAVEEIDADLEPLEPVLDLEAALVPEAPLIHEGLGSNLAARGTQAFGDYEGARARADLVLARRLVYDRGAAAAIENRGVAARWDPASGGLLVWDTTQAPALTRTGLAEALGLPASRVHVVAPFVGGGFGPKFAMFYPEELVVPWIAMHLGRPVKWIEDRYENFFATTQERCQIHDAEIAVTREGEILGIRDAFLQDTGAYNPYGATLPLNTQWAVPGPYRVPSFHGDFRSVFTSRTPVTPVRGAGQQAAVFVIERLLDLAARELGIDRLEIRRRNLIPPDALPWDRGLTYHDGTRVAYDSGDYRAALDCAAEAIGYERFAREERSRRPDGRRRVGIGIVPYVEGTGYGPPEGARVRVDARGKVTVATAIGTQGQGHFTTLAQVVAEVLGVEPRDVEVVTGDTRAFREGVGTFASRGAVAAANACHAAALAVREQLLDRASEIIEVARADLELEDGAVRVKGAPAVAVTFQELARASAGSRHDVEPPDSPDAPVPGSPRQPGGLASAANGSGVAGVEATCSFDPPGATTPYGVHALVVALDPDTLTVEILRYVVVHDCGRMINPRIIEGQIQGGVAMGIGNAFYEELACGPDGRLRNASLRDYLLPGAAEVPEIEVIHRETPSPLNPLGTKGMGEGGAIPVAAAFVQALEDALADRRVEILEIPLSPDRLFALLHRAAPCIAGRGALGA